MMNIKRIEEIDRQMKKVEKETSGKKALEREANKLWKLACLLKWGNKSILSGKPANVFHHFIYKSHSKLLQFDVKNGIPLTKGEHWLIHNAGSDRTFPMIKKIRQKRGENWCRYIDRKKKDHKYSYYTVDFVKKQIKKLKRIIKSYDRG